MQSLVTLLTVGAQLAVIGALAITLSDNEERKSVVAHLTSGLDDQNAK